MAGSCGFVLMLLYVVYDLPANPLDPSYVPFWKRFLRRFFEVRSFGRNLGKFERVLGIFCEILAYLTDIFGSPSAGSA